MVQARGNPIGIVILPILRPVFFSAAVILSILRSRALIWSKHLQAVGLGTRRIFLNFMYTFAFNRAQMGIGAASAMIMLFGVLAILVPYLYSELGIKPWVIYSFQRVG